MGQTGGFWPVSENWNKTVGLCKTGIGAMKYSENWLFSPVLNLVFSFNIPCMVQLGLSVSQLLKSFLFAQCNNNYAHLFLCNLDNLMNIHCSVEDTTYLHGGGNFEAFKKIVFWVFSGGIWDSGRDHHRRYMELTLFIEFSLN